MGWGRAGVQFSTSHLSGRYIARALWYCAAYSDRSAGAVYCRHVGERIHISADFATEASQKSPPLKPTFSWITARDTVWYDNGLSWDEMPYPTCTLLHAHVVPATVDPFGRIASARVTLSGKTVLGSRFFQEVRNREVDEHVDSLCIWIDKFNGPLPGSIPEPDLRFEVFNESCDWTSVICLGLYSGLVKGVGKITMLLLQPEFGTDSYVRVGLVSYMEKDWFDQRAIERTVVVV
jgi:hypothetical protein